MEMLMYPEKTKNHPKPKHSLIRLILALLFFVPSLLFILPHFNPEQFIDIALLIIMITLTIYLVYQTLGVFLINTATMDAEHTECSDLSSE